MYLAGPPERRLRILRSGDIFGEMALITEQPRSAGIRALEDTEVRVIHREDFPVIWQHDPGALVNGTLIGGPAHVGRVQLWAGPNDLTIGGRGTPYRFRLTVTAPA